MSLLWNVAKSANVPNEIYWIAQHNKEDDLSDPYFCSLNTTALIALQGIKEGLSPLGDLLFSSFYTTRDFIEKNQPHGVSKVVRLHLSRDEEDLDKIKNRFGSIENNLSLNDLPLGPGIEEEAYSVDPARFLNWFEKEITTLLPQLIKINDWAVDLDTSKKELSTLSGQNISYDSLVLCTGALGSDFTYLNEHLPKKFKKSMGHFLHWENIHFEDESFCPEDSFVLTWGGHNLIYRREMKTMIWGGSTYSDDISAPRSKELSTSLTELLTHHPCLKFTGDQSVRSGVRSKASRRMPIINLSADGCILSLNGFYKNGWTLCHELGRKGAELILGVKT